MLALVQRVQSAHVEVDKQIIGQIERGLLVFVYAQASDTPAHTQKLLSKLLEMRIFSDDAGKMNHCLKDIDGKGHIGGLLLISQFTLAADTSSGRRPSFSGAAPAAQGRALMDHLITLARSQHPIVATGEFGANMRVHLINDGPVTIPMRVE